jgi:hypothetical protein
VLKYEDQNKVGQLSLYHYHSGLDAGEYVLRSSLDAIPVTLPTLSNLPIFLGKVFEIISTSSLQVQNYCGTGFAAIY